MLAKYCVYNRDGKINKQAVSLAIDFPFLFCVLIRKNRLTTRLSLIFIVELLLSIAFLFMAIGKGC